jgi:hypothetical protein
MSPNQTATAMILDTCTDTCISKKRSCAIVKELTSSLNSLLPNTCDFHSLWIQLQHSQKVKNNATGSSSTTAINSTGQSLGISKRSSLISPKQKLSSKERILYTENFIAVQRDIDWLQSKLDPSHVDFMVIGGSGEFGDNDNNDESNSLLALFQQVNQKRSQEQSLKSDVTKAKVQKQSILEMDRTVQQLRDKIQNLVQKIQILKVEGNYHGLNHEEVIRARREAFTRDWNFQQEDLREKSSKKGLFLLSLFGKNNYSSFPHVCTITFRGFQTTSGSPTRCTCEIHVEEQTTIRTAPIRNKGKQGHLCSRITTIGTRIARDTSAPRTKSHDSAQTSTRL